MSDVAAGARLSSVSDHQPVVHLRYEEFAAPQGNLSDRPCAAELRLAVLEVDAHATAATAAPPEADGAQEVHLVVDNLWVEPYSAAAAQRVAEECPCVWTWIQPTTANASAYWSLPTAGGRYQVSWPSPLRARAPKPETLNPKPQVRWLKTRCEGCVLPGLGFRV